MPSLAGRLRIAWRVFACCALFSVVGPTQMLFTAFGRRDLLPPPFLGAVGWLCGLRVRTEGKPASGPTLFLANHVSWLDILALAGVTRTAFAGKDALAGHPFLRWLCEQNATIFLQRDRRHTVSQQVDEVRAALARQPLTIFPEGTTSDGTGLLPFKSSLLAAAESASVTIQPVALDYEQARQIAWGAEPGLVNVWSILARKGVVHLTIRFLEPLSGQALIHRKAMAASAQAEIGAALRL